MDTSDDLTTKKKTRSFVSFFMDKKQSDTDKDESRSTYYQKQWQTNTYNNPQIQIKSNSSGYLQMLDELINENNSCFGFSILHITSKSCLYMSIILYLGICLIISLVAIFKK